MLSVSLNVFSLYADQKTAELASRVCGSLREKLGDDFQIKQSTWNAELLKNSKLRALAAREAVNSDLVIMAVSEGAELPEEVRHWFELWRNRRRSSPSALVALLKREHPGAPPIVAKKLKAFAAAARMDFFCHSELDRPAVEGRAAPGVTIVWPELRRDHAESSFENSARP